MSNHSIKATAKTRATNRAISELIGAGDVSADELDPAFDKVQHSKTNHVIEAEVVRMMKMWDLRLPTRLSLWTRTLYAGTG